MIRTLFLILIFAWISFGSHAQSFEKIALDAPDEHNLYINDGIDTELHYLRLVPKSEIKGAIVIIPAGGEKTDDVVKQLDLPQLASKEGIITVVPSINWGTEERKAEVTMLNEIIGSLIKDYNVPHENFVFGGLSNGGVVALSYAIHAIKNEGSTVVKPCGIFGLDVPLDKAHFYEYCLREIDRNFSEAGVGEARWIKNYYDQVYGGSPEEFPERYV